MGSVNQISYSFNHGLVHYLRVNTTVYYSGDEAEINAHNDFVAEDLQKANENRGATPWVIVVGDRPYYCANALGECAFNARDNQSATYQRKELSDLNKVLNDHDVDLAIWARGNRYERLLPVNERTIYFRSGLTIPDTYNNPPATVHIIIGSQDNCSLVDESVPWTRSPWSGFASGSGHEWGFVVVSVFNESHLHIKQTTNTGDTSKADSIWLVKSTHKNTFNPGKFSGGMKMPESFCFNKRHCPPEQSTALEGWSHM